MQSNKTRKRVLILGHNDVVPFVDVCNQYTRVFDRNLYEVTVAYLTGPSNEKTKNSTQSEHVIFLNLSRKQIKKTKIRAITRVYRLCKQQHFDLVICHRYKPTYIMLWVARFYRFTAVICVIHEFKTYAALGRQLLMGCLQQRNTLFVGVSNAVRDDMRKDLWTVSNKKISTLYNMIDVDELENNLLTREIARQKLQITPDTFLFGNIARLATNKDQTTLIKAFALLNKAHTNTKLIIVGTGKTANALKLLVRDLQLEQHVIFTGYLESASHYLRAFDAFVLSSTQEAFGRVLLEAMVAKVPIIASRVDGIPEVVSPHHILFNPKNVLELTGAMEKILLSPPKYHLQTTKKAYDYVLDNFSITKFREIFWQTVPPLSF